VILQTARILVQYRFWQFLTPIFSFFVRNPGIAREEEDNLFKHFQAITRGTKELKLHKTRREDFSSKNLQGSATKLRQKNTTAMQSFAIANGLGQPIDDEKGFLLGPISLTLQPGQITYIVGGNGSGKSTLAKLITGLYPPKNGSIYLDGVLITDENREWYRQHFSAIFSDFYLFDSCLGFNHPNLDREVESYLRQLQLDHKVQVRDGVLSTTNLSQGQRKRLALLTAYLEDRPIYLFDEWASDQEPHFRDLFYRQSLVKLKERGKAVIVITHDDRYFHLADQIIKLDYGKVQPDYVPIRFS
ncbi:MAG: ATP-binding cassette domain-containing protein, partial [Nostoc sp.]|uniref:ATP-binding cassette domain-containing protein n=1 Tax=Nostoc sp. TaxID=1180 RepID=UPI002FF5954A